MTPLRVAVVGAGWAGISAAVHSRLAGHEVSVFEMAAQAGGRARTVRAAGLDLDNGQHILIGAYEATLELMVAVGADIPSLLCRLPLALQYPDGTGLRLRAGHPVPAFVRAVLGRRDWTWADRLRLLSHAARWALQSFRCDETATVVQLCAGLPERVQMQLIEPLCVAALNTPASQASASVFLRVLHDALFGAPGSSDLLLARKPLGALLPQPAAAWFEQQGVALRHGTRITGVEADGAAWRVDGDAFDHVVLACSATEAARLSEAHAPQWAASAAALRYEPIITVYLRCPGARLPLPMIALHSGAEAPAQFAFDLGALGEAAGVFAMVVSGARDWVERGLPATGQAALEQAKSAFAAGTWPQPPTLLHVAAEKRATFRCTPQLVRPPVRIAPGLWAVGDYVEGPYPATLEGAVRAGRQVARQMAASTASAS